MEDKYYTAMGRAIASAVTDLAVVDHQLNELREQESTLAQRRRDLTEQRREAELAIVAVKSNIYDVVYVPHE